ncbi:hypothetical protein Q4I28_007821 [Leishmania naiffi]|uniref:IQ calmodulin-binding motif containing protein n=1 Tax=Leishmania naiffi TaxID=5678 RepID=A0AAW3B255_9TRYP
MQKRRTASATVLPQEVVVPHPPMSGTSAAVPRHRSYQANTTASSRPRHVSLNPPRHVPRCIFTAPTSVPWACTLRRSDDIFASISRSRQRHPRKAGGGDPLPLVKSSAVPSAEKEKSLAVHCAPFGEKKLSMEGGEDSSHLNGIFDGGLSSSTLVAWPPKEPRRLSSQLGRSLRLKLDTAAIEEELGCSTNSPLENTVSLTDSQLVKFAAYDTLRLLFLPIWKLYRFHKQMVQTMAIVAKYAHPKIFQRRQRCNERTPGTILPKLRIPHTKLRWAAYFLETQAVCIQSAFRRHRARVQAVVELNYRKVRRDVEEAYWATVVAQREAELTQQQYPFNALSNAVRQVIEASAESKMRTDTTTHRTNLLTPAANSTPATEVPSYELDVYNFFMIGRLPESLLRFETTSAVFAQLRRSAARAHLIDDFSSTRAQRSAKEELRKPNDIPSTHKPVVCRRKCHAQLPHFLPESVYVAILNNTCYMTSLMRDDRMLRAHLHQQKHPLEPY